MKKILIVDDNESNRILLRALLEGYAEDNNDVLDIQEAVNGLEASLVSEDKHFDLILMDIMMPEMDGIEATRRIRARDTKTMIVAVSAVDDGDHQRQMLRNGAEDYLFKPVNEDVFMARLGTYFSLIDSRNACLKKFNPSAANLFTQEVFSRKFLFYVQSEDELAEFWEYYLLESSQRSEGLSDAIRTVYALASVGLKFGAKLQIIVEESAEYMYVTLAGIENIDAKIIKLIMIKNPNVTEYKTENGKFCIRLPHPRILEPVPTVREAEATAVIASAQPQTPAAVYTAEREEYHVYDYMEEEDLMDLREYVGKLNSLMLVVGGEIESHEVNEISGNLQNISRICSGYTDSYSIGKALAAMGRTIMSHSGLFMQKSGDLAPMCAAFGRDLSTWIRMVFVEGTPHVHYMDDTIIANAQTIESILTMDDADHSGAAEDLDDIFDF
ncbi:MAG: Response regulatory protein [Campylobacterota bacterium]|nr:Response regulatory protein [Campylobacterota bacterium]